MIASRTPWSLLGCWTVVEDKQGHLKKKTLVRALSRHPSKKAEYCRKRCFKTNKQWEEGAARVCLCVWMTWGRVVLSVHLSNVSRLKSDKAGLEVSATRPSTPPPPPPPPLLVVRQLESKKSSSSLCPGRQAAAHQGAVRGIPSSTLMFCPAGLRLIMQASKCQDGRQVHIQSLESLPKSKRLKTPLLALSSSLSQSLSALRLNRERTKSLFRYWGKLKLNVYQLIERF